MKVSPIQINLRAKKLGVLIADARIAAGKQVADCARLIGVQPADYENYELGLESPSLPELELLAHFLLVPLEHFWEQDSLLSIDFSEHEIDLEQLFSDRNKAIAASLQSVRLEAGLSLEQVVSQLGLEAGQLEVYESGYMPVPLPILEALTDIYSIPVRQYFDENGPFGKLDDQQQLIQEYLQLPAELRKFVAQPVNRPYLEMAQRLSDLSVDKLRAVAEVLLEITL